MLHVLFNRKGIFEVIFNEPIYLLEGFGSCKNKTCGLNSSIGSGCGCDYTSENCSSISQSCPYLNSCSTVLDNIPVIFDNSI